MRKFLVATFCLLSTAAYANEKVVTVTAEFDYKARNCSSTSEVGVKLLGIATRQAFKDCNGAAVVPALSVSYRVRMNERLGPSADPEEYFICTITAQFKCR